MRVSHRGKACASAASEPGPPAQVLDTLGHISRRATLYIYYAAVPAHISRLVCRSRKLVGRRAGGRGVPPFDRL